jgi:hypothetical protein
LSGPVLSSSPSSPASLSPTSTSLGHDHVPSNDEVPLLSILSSGIYQVDALLAIPKAKEFVQTLVAMDTCCGLDLIRKTLVPKDAIKPYVADAPHVCYANGRVVNLSAAISLEGSIADQVFKRTLLISPQLSMSLILGTAFMEEHVKSHLPRKRLMIISSSVSIPLVDDTRRSTSAFKCYALLRMRPLSIPCAECSVVISCGKVDYDKSG